MGASWIERLIGSADSSEGGYSGSKPAQESVSAADRWAALVLLGAALVLRLLYIWHYRIDSDEPQHLHVVWGWTRGLLPYQKVFDNHSPLFQALYAPLFYLLGDRADIVLPMRAGQLPLYALTVFCVWKIARALYAPRTAWWTAVLTALCPPFFLDSIEFRPDQLWTLVWMLVLLVLVTGAISPRRALLAGVLCGVAFSVSMKSSLLLAALAQAFVGAFLVRRAAGAMPLHRPALLRCAALWLAGLVVVPALVVLYFYLHGALHDLAYGVIHHNILPGSSKRVVSSGAIKMWLLGAGWAALGGYVIAHLRLSMPLRTRIAFVFFAASLYYTTLVGSWPVLTAEDYLPFFPAMMLIAVPVVLWLERLVLRGLSFPTAAVLAVGELAAILIMVSPFQDQTADKIGMVADTLKLTEPSDYVMDSKGETIYRQRPFYYVIESMTFHRMQKGLIQDTVAAELIEKRVPLSTVTTRIPRKSRGFIRKNYVPIAFRLSVLGKRVREADVPAGQPSSFEIAVPQRYTLITPTGPPAGLLDGTPFTGPRELSAGPHTFLPEGNPGSVVLIWAAALERGYSPFAKIKADYTTPQD